MFKKDAYKPLPGRWTKDFIGLQANYQTYSVSFSEPWFGKTSII
jgi:hypothetical protein